MVFSSFPVYLDHPNLHQFQQPDHQQVNGVENPHLPPPSPVLPVGGDGGTGSIRPGSMVDRARIAKIPLPEAGLKCPRCDSTNTKFCYFNNYNLSQPRHFCKTCRRYWTRGGALRNVPVGGGCRRNKKNKGSSSSSKSSASNDRQMGTNSTSASPSTCSTHMGDHFSQSSTQLPLMAALQNLNNYGGVHLASNIGGFQPQMVPTGGNGLTDMGFNIGSNLGGENNNLSGGGSEQWKLTSLAGFEPSMNLFPFQNEGVELTSSMIRDHRLPPMTSSSGGVSQMASVKMEANGGLNLSKQFLGASEENQHWATSTWTGISGLNSSSTTHLL